MPHMVMAHETDPKDVLLHALGDIRDVEVFNNQVLVAVYVRPAKTQTGIYLPDNYREEDKIQGKVGLVVAKGPDAFHDASGRWFNGVTLDVNDWIVFRPSDGWSVTVNKVLCRVLEDTSVKGRIQHPDQVW